MFMFFNVLRKLYFAKNAKKAIFFIIFKLYFIFRLYIEINKKNSKKTGFLAKVEELKMYTINNIYT